MSDSVGAVWCDTIHNHFIVLYANWPLGQPLRLGDYGILVNGGWGPFSRGTMFTRRGNITDPDYNIKITERPDPNFKSYSFQSSKGVSVDFAAKGDMTPTGGTYVKASMTVSFSKQSAAFFNSVQCTFKSIENISSVGKAIMQFCKDKKWDKNLVVVTNIVDAGTTTALISLSDSASITMEAEGDVSNIDLANASLKLNIKSYTDVGIRAATDNHLIPLIGLSGVQTHLIREYEFGSIDPNVETVIEETQKVIEETQKRDIPFEDSFYFGRIR